MHTSGKNSAKKCRISTLLTRKSNKSLKKTANTSTNWLKMYFPTSYKPAAITITTTTTMAAFWTWRTNTCNTYAPLSQDGRTFSRPRKRSLKDFFRAKSFSPISKDVSNRKLKVKCTKFCLFCPTALTDKPTTTKTFKIRSIFTSLSCKICRTSFHILPLYKNKKVHLSTLTLVKFLLKTIKMRPLSKKKK